MNTTGIMTGEGVLLESEPASVLTRVLSGAIDYTVYGMVMYVAALVGSAVSLFDRDGDAGIGTALALSAMVIMLVGVPVAVETATGGRSLGRLALGVRIVRDDGGAVTVRHALIRSLTAVVEVWMTGGVIAIITSMVHPRGKRLGDLLAGTYATRVRGGPKDQLTVVMPPALARWAPTADVGRLPDGLSLAVRQFLGRTARMHPASRVRLGTELTAQVQQHVRPLPPPGTHPEDFLMAVLAERRLRESRAEASRVARAHKESDILGRLPFGVVDDTA